jgi:hypothetical protein
MRAAERGMDAMMKGALREADAYLRRAESKTSAVKHKRARKHQR